MPELWSGGFPSVTTHHDEGTGLLVVERGQVVVAANFGTAPVDAPLPGRPRDTLLSSGDVKVGAGSVLLGPDSVAVMAG